MRGLIVVAILVVVLLALFGLYTGPSPEVSLEPRLPGIGRRTPVAVRVAHPERLEKVTVELIQGEEAKPVAEQTFEPRPAWKFWEDRDPMTFTVEVGRETVEGLRAGDATVRVTAQKAGTALRSPDPGVSEVTLPVRLAPPTVAVLSNFHFVNQGGSELVVYRVGDSAVRSGVRSGEWWFPGFQLPGGGPQDRFAPFAVPYDLGDPSQVRLVAEDDVGNQAEAAFIDKFTPRPLRTDTIQVDEAFMSRVVPEILAQSPEVQDRGSLLENYLAINRDLRKKNAQTLKELGDESVKEFLWTKPFLPMLNAAITAAFADRRTYVYNGQEIDQQDHLGFDMASVERDAIRASNRGRVVLARYFGIYGNAVVIDHGYGLQSLYGHLSSIGVQEGQQVERGQEIGRSGATGLAGGDHLHFTMLLQGLAVTPVEWWDPHWIQDRIARKLGPALKFEP